jgi:hypothetical protein
MSDDDEMFSNDDTVTITGSSTIDSAGYMGTGVTMSSLTLPSITTISGTGPTVGSSVYTIGGGGGGGVGAMGSGIGGVGGTYLTSTGTSTGWTTISPNTKTVFKTQNGDEVSVEEIIDMMKIMKERLLILTPLFEKHEKYAALKKAYDNYKLIEALLQEEKVDDK